MASVLRLSSCPPPITEQACIRPSCLPNNTLRTTCVSQFQGRISIPCEALRRSSPSALTHQPPGSRAVSSSPASVLLKRELLSSSQDRELRLNGRLKRVTCKREMLVPIGAAAADDVGGGTEGGGTSDSSLSLPERVAAFRFSFWKFLRPHTIRGTTLGATALVARALLENSHLINWNLLPRALLGLLALLCGNGYIVGINQIYDTDIDRVNKPFLPVAAGELSPAAAWVLCLLLSGGGFTIVALNFGRLITILYALGLFLGTIYSVPPLRLKRFALPAFLIIATVRGLLLNFGVYYATRAALGLTFAWSPSIVFITVFVTVFATVIAITKDLPDVEGDKRFQIETFATRAGVRTVAFLGSGLLLMNYVGAVAAAVLLPKVFRTWVMMGAHSVLALALILETLQLDRKQYTRDSIAGFYRFIWNLFYSEYLLLPAI